MKFYPKFESLKKQLEEQGHEAIIPLSDEYYEQNNLIKKNAMEDFDKNLEESDAILVANYEKNNIPNYVGTNSIMEVGMAFNQKKKIFILFNIPENCKYEFESAGVIELNGDISNIK